VLVVVGGGVLVLVLLVLVLLVLVVVVPRTLVLVVVGTGVVALVEVVPCTLVLVVDEEGALVEVVEVLVVVGPAAVVDVREVVDVVDVLVVVGPAAVVDVVDVVDVLVVLGPAAVVDVREVVDVLDVLRVVCSMCSMCSRCSSSWGPLRWSTCVTWSTCSMCSSVEPGTVVVVKHWFGPGTHTLAPLHLSPTVQMLLSLHGVSTGLAGFWQPSVGLHESVVQRLLSLQLSGGVGDWQRPLVHCSTPLHTLPSLQETPSLTARLRQPRVASHESEVQALLSLQFSTRQKLVHPSQLAVFPDWSQVSGNSTVPLPHAGHGTRQLV
jgi:hypothetical protein